MAFLHNDKEQFAEAIHLTAYQTGIMAQAIEKDYYVSLILRRLAQKMPFIVFKGGTSLSKCHGVIKRFSEGIDITIDTQITQGQKKAVKDAVVAISDELGMAIINLDETHSRRDYNKYIIAYESVLPLVSEAVQPAVLMETSYKDHFFSNGGSACEELHRHNDGNGGSGSDCRIRTGTVRYEGAGSGPHAGGQGVCSVRLLFARQNSPAFASSV